MRGLLGAVVRRAGAVRRDRCRASARPSATHAGRGALVVVAARSLLLVVLSAATARALSTTLAAGLSSRRGRDATDRVRLGLLHRRCRACASSGGTPSVRTSWRRLDDVLRWTPPGMLGQAAFDSRATGTAGRALAELIPASVADPAAAAAWWARALERSMTVDGRRRDPADAGARRDRRCRCCIAALPFLDRRPWGAVTAKELRYLGREPRRKVNLVNSIIIGVGLPVWAALHSSGDGRGKAVLLATLGAYIAVLGSSNQYGLDGAAAWLDMVAGRHGPHGADRQERRRGSSWCCRSSLVVGTARGRHHRRMGVPARRRSASRRRASGPGWRPATSISVRFPLRLPESRSPFAGAGGGQGCSTGLVLTVCLLAQNVLLLPVVGAGLISLALGPASLLLTVPARPGLRRPAVVGRPDAGDDLRRRPPARAARAGQPVTVDLTGRPNR